MHKEYEINLEISLKIYVTHSSYLNYAVHFKSFATSRIWFPFIIVRKLRRMYVYWMRTKWTKCTKSLKTSSEMITGGRELANTRATISVAQFLPFFTLIWFCRWFVFCWYEFWIAMNVSCSLFFTNTFRYGILKRIKSIKISLFANWKAPSVELKVSLKWHHFLHGKCFYNEN